MKTIIFAALSLCGLVAGSPHLHAEREEAPTHQLHRRATGVIEQGLYNISNSTQALANDIRTFTRDDIFVLQAANANAVGTIRNATEQIRNSEPIELEEAIVLTPIILMLVEATQMSVNATIDKKQTFGGLVPVVQANLMQQKQASQQLNLAIATKLPQNLIAISAQSSQPIFNSLDAGIEEFSTAVENTPQNSPELFGRMRSAGVGLTAFSQAIFATALVGAVAALQSL